MNAKGQAMTGKGALRDPLMMMERQMSHARGLHSPASMGAILADTQLLQLLHQGSVSGAMPMAPRRANTTRLDRKRNHVFQQLLGDIQQRFVPPMAPAAEKCTMSEPRTANCMLGTACCLFQCTTWVLILGWSNGASAKISID